MRDIVAGLAHLHTNGFIHRDLKPQNVLICKYSSIRGKVSEMAIGKCLPAEGTTGYGSPGWQAPELFHEEPQITNAVDLFSLGCLLFFCITGGQHPFGVDMDECDKKIKEEYIVEALKNISLVENIPEALDLVSNLIRPDPGSRPSAAEVYHHPLFWDPDMRLSFLRDASNRLYLAVSKTGNPDLPPETEESIAENKTNSELLNKLESSAKDVFDSRWDAKLGDIVSDDKSDKKHQKTSKISHQKTFKISHQKTSKISISDYDPTMVRELVRFIRNIFTHYNQLPKDVQKVLVNVPTGFEKYFRSQFPKLLMEVYKVLKEYCREEESLKKYFKKSVD